MHKFLFTLLLMFAVPVYAQQTQETVDNEIDLLAPVEEEQEEVVIIPQQEVVLPSCQDENLLAQVKKIIENYNTIYPVTTIYEKRQRALQLKNTKEFEEEQVSGFSAKQNRYVADKLLMTKINEGLDDKEVRLCKSVIVNKQFPPVYLMMYKDKQNNIQVFVLNYIKGNTDDLKMVLEN